MLMKKQIESFHVYIPIPCNSHIKGSTLLFHFFELASALMSNTVKSMIKRAG